MDRLSALKSIAAEAGRGELSFPTSVNATLKLQRALGEPDFHIDDAARLVQAEPLLAAQTFAATTMAGLLVGFARGQPAVAAAEQDFGAARAQLRISADVPTAEAHWMAAADRLSAANAAHLGTTASHAFWGGRVGAGGAAVAAGLMAIDDSRAWREENLPAAVNAPLNTVTEAAHVAMNGPAPVFPVGAAVHSAVAGGLEPFIGATPARYAALLPAGAADIAATAMTGGIYGGYNAVAAAGNVLAAGREDPSVREARFAEAADYKYWENQAYEWAAARGDQNFTLGDAQRTASDMAAALSQPAGAGIAVFTPDGRSFERIDPEYAAARDSLVASGVYSLEDLSSYSPSELTDREHAPPSPTYELAMADPSYSPPEIGARPNDYVTPAPIEDSPNAADVPVVEAAPSAAGSPPVEEPPAEI
jgi:hypothetical protein